MTNCHVSILQHSGTQQHNIIPALVLLNLRKMAAMWTWSIPRRLVKSTVLLMTEYSINILRCWFTFMLLLLLFCFLSCDAAAELCAEIQDVSHSVFSLLSLQRFSHCSCCHIRCGSRPLLQRQVRYLMSAFISWPQLYVQAQIETGNVAVCSRLSHHYWMGVSPSLRVTFPSDRSLIIFRQRGTKRYR